MSQEHIHEILGLASVEPEFCQALLRDPLQAVQERGFVLSPKEQEILGVMAVDNLYDLSKYLLEHLFPLSDRDEVE